ncbi:MAG TPA: hypothetical protein VG939_08505 [Caulobacteraceae bacterium]|nr:hypothetical protein [Caulobacteraceae bacterium]
MPRYLPVAVAALTLAAPLAARAQLIDVSTDWKTRTGLQTYCPDATERRVVVQGPGRLVLRIEMKPYRSAGKMAYVPITWTEFRADGSNTGWGDTPFAGHQYTRWTSAGREVRNFIDGQPLEMERVWNLDARKYAVGVRLGAPCQSLGGAGFTQFGQAQHLVLAFEGATSNTTAPPTQTTRRVFDNSNGGAVANRPTRPTVLRLGAATFVATITDYHWNGGAGAAPGTIALRDASGHVFGPWRARLQGKAYWVATVNVRLPAGTYTVIDSDLSTWSQNAGSGGAGMSWLEGYPAG